MNPSKLNKRITLLKQSRLKNTYGEFEDVWNDVATVWANVRTLRGRELFQADQVHSETSVKLIIRYRSDITADMTVKYGNRTFEIVGQPINIDESNRFLEIMCKEVI